MRDFIIDTLTDLAGLSMEIILLNNAVAVVLALFIMFSYYSTYSGTAYSKRFNATLGVIPIITTLIMSVISNNIALSLGMVGALSIIRFRTPVKDPRDATFIFWAIAVGVACGVSQFMIAAVSSLVIFLFLIVTRQTHHDGKLLLIVKCSLEAQNKAQAAVDEYFSKAARLRMKNANSEFCELVYEVNQSVVSRIMKRTRVDIVEKLLKIEGVLNVNQVEQSDDISR